MMFKFNSSFIFSVINATHNHKKVRYNESKVFCASKNLTLPQTAFRVIETMRSQRKSIFWIADNEETRNAAREKNREHLDVAFYPQYGGREICAALGNIFRAVKNLFHCES